MYFKCVQYSDNNDKINSIKVATFYQLFAHISTLLLLITIADQYVWTKQILV